MLQSYLTISELIRIKSQKGCNDTTFSRFIINFALLKHDHRMKYLNIKKALAAWQALQPLSEKDRERLSRRFTVDFNYNSNHIEGNTLTYGQTEILLLFGKVVGEADVRDVEEMTASNVGLRMMTEEASVRDMPLTQNFMRTLHKTLLREDHTVYRNLPGGLPLAAATLAQTDAEVAHRAELSSLYESCRELQALISGYSTAVTLTSHPQLLRKALDGGEITLLEYLLEAQYYHNALERLYGAEAELAREYARLTAEEL